MRPYVCDREKNKASPSSRETDVKKWLFFKKVNKKNAREKIRNKKIQIQNNNKMKQERQIMHLAYIMNTFQDEKDKVEFKLFKCLYEEI